MIKLALFSVFFSITGFAQVAGPAPFLVKDHGGIQILADSKGRTLYIFDKDTGGKSVCYNGCAKVWPPAFLIDNPATSVALPVGTTVRNDQSVQLTYEGKPVYLYASDESATDVNGDGVGGVWHIIAVK